MLLGIEIGGTKLQFVAGDEKGSIAERRRIAVNAGGGVRAGLAVDGRIYHGAPPGELEFGHIALERGGITVEERCSGWAVDAQIREAVKRSPESRLSRLVRAAGDGAEARQLAP